ncbi:Uncharacterised protein [Acinetobacter junii]|uniref:SH3 domain-containing protein n=1 Tax=Acinetobacter junii TaxID=40215 RepID=UPI001A646013|nr:SH3 domain-containing protein [Acinetobacter junii]VTX53618.1 Uncharacterised protein [Acinetobacter junii]
MRNIVFIGVIISSIHTHADYQNISQNSSFNQLEELTETLNKGSYIHPDEIDLPAVSNPSRELHDKTIELSDSEIKEKFASDFHAIAKRYVNSNILNVRDNPNGKVIDQLKRGQSVFIYDVKGDWERVSKENERQKWVDSNFLCSTLNCYYSSNNVFNNRVINKTTKSRNKVTKKMKVTSIDVCTCGTGSYCYGPRGGRFCYTSGGNKAYR